MNNIMSLATMISVFYSIFILRKYKEYKRLDLSSEIILEDDNKIYRIMGPIIVAFSIVFGCILLYDNYSNGKLDTEIIINTILNTIFFVSLYLPFSIKPTASIHGIYKFGNLIEWDQIAGIEYREETRRRKMQAVIYYKNTSGKRLITTVIFGKNNENYKEFKSLQNKAMPEKKK